MKLSRKKKLRIWNFDDMVGAIIGDIVGSKYEFNNIKTKDFDFFCSDMEFTDDSILTAATADWILRGGDVNHYYSDWGNSYPCPMGGYGNRFKEWLIRANKQNVYMQMNSCGNGSAMRVAPVGWAFDTEEEVLSKAKESAECTHNHPGGIAGAQAVALAIFMVRQGKSKDDIRKEITERFGYNLSYSVENLQQVYSWDGMPDEEWSGATCQGSVPQAIICALDADDYEDAIRNAISIGGDSDTIACITGGIAEALYDIPEDIRVKGLSYLDEKMRTMVETFEKEYRNEDEITKAFYLREFSENGINASPDVLNRLAESLIIPSFIAYDMNDVLADFKNSHVYMKEVIFENWDGSKIDTDSKTLHDCFDTNDAQIVHIHIRYPSDLTIEELILLNEECQKMAHNDCNIKLHLIQDQLDKLVIHVYYAE